MTTTDFDRPPDIWWGSGQDREMRFWCIEGVWFWRNVDEDGTVLAEGEGRP